MSLNNVTPHNNNSYSGKRACEKWLWPRNRLSNFKKVKTFVNNHIIDNYLLSLTIMFLHPSTIYCNLESWFFEKVQIFQFQYWGQPSKIRWRVTKHHTFIDRIIGLYTNKYLSSIHSEHLKTESKLSLCKNVKCLLTRSLWRQKDHVLVMPWSSHHVIKLREGGNHTFPPVVFWGLNGSMPKST